MASTGTVEDDAAGNATHVSYSGVINPPTTIETFGGTPPPGPAMLVAASQDRDDRDDEPADPCGYTLAAVDDEPDSSEPTVHPGVLAPPTLDPIPDRAATFEAVPGIGGDTAAVWAA